MRILVTGVTGFAGGHLAEALLARGQAEVFGTCRKNHWPAALAPLAGQIALCSCDLCAGPAVERMLRQVQPQQIFHLAGYAHAGQSFREPDAAWQDNLQATRCLYDAIARWGGKPRILYVGSGLVYGLASAPGQRADENCPLCPVSPYAASKAAADIASYQYSHFPGLDIVRVRPFNHVGPRQSPQYAIAHFAKQIAAIERKQQPPILETGNLTPVRDLTDVRDMVQAYILLMEHGRTGEAYNVAGGQALAIQTVVDRLLALAKIPIEVRQRADLVRAGEAPVFQGHSTKLRRETGWTPHYTLEQTLADTLIYWRQAP